MGDWGRTPWGLWKPHWNNRSGFGNRRLSFAIIVMFSLMVGLPYVLTNRLAHYMDRNSLDIELPLDTELPFIAWMVIPYISLYFYYPTSALLGSKNDLMWRQNIVFTQIVVITSWICFGVFVLLPVEIDLRHLIVGVEGTAWEPWFALVHGADRPWNSWPSLHVVQSTQVVLILRYWYPSETRKVWILQSLLLVCWALLVISTMTIKQHYLWDAVSALTLTGITWRYWMKPALDRCAAPEYAEVFDEAMKA